jgi:hypothetical protein
MHVQAKRHPGPASSGLRGRLLRGACYLICLALSVAMFFRKQLSSGFDLLFGSRTDTIIEMTILEHWYNVLRGHSSWSTGFYYYPYTGTLGFNDGYFLYGLPYSLLRLSGVDPFLGSELVNVLLRVVAFAAFHLFLRRSLLLGPWWSLLGAVLFTLSCTMAMRAIHAQLLSVCFVPLFAWLACNAAEAFAAGAYRRFVLWGSLAALLMSAWLVTAYYMAWFTLFFLSCATLLGVLSSPGAVLRGVRTLPGRGWAGVAAVASVFAAGIVPFLALYLPKARMTGMHPFAEVLSYTVQPLDLIHVGDGNLLLARLDALLNGYFRPELPRYSEHTTGLTLLLLVVFVLACASLCARGQAPGGHASGGRAPGGQAARRRERLLAATAVLTWLLTLRIGDWSAWVAVFDLVPGAAGLRVVARYQLFLAAPVIAVATAYLAGPGAQAPRPLAAILALVLVAEQITVQQPVALDRPAELARLRSIPAPPPSCRSFFVSRARANVDLPPEVDAVYSHNVDGMLLSEWFGLPTLNGFGTFEPPDWNFVGPDRPDYLQRVRTYARAHDLADVCAVDLLAKRWDTDPLGPAGAAPPRPG